MVENKKPEESPLPIDKPKPIVAFFTLKQILPSRTSTFIADKDAQGKPKVTGRHVVLNTMTYKLKGVVDNLGPVDGILAEGAELIVHGLRTQDWTLGQELRVEISKA